MNYRKIFLLFFVIFLLSFQFADSQIIKYMVPDTGSQGRTFPVTISGSETFWTASSYVEIYFDSIGVQGSNVVIVNDTVLNATVTIEGIASTGFHQLQVSDQFLNLVTKDSALFVRLAAPAAPNLLSPPNNYQFANTNQLFKWDTNGYATSFRIQVARDSLFNIIVKDTTKPNIHGYKIPDILLLNTYYWWRVMFFNSLGQSPWSVVFKFKTRITGVNQIGNNIPDNYKLYNNFPNPFNPVTKIKFDIPHSYNGENTKIVIYNVLGQEIHTLINEKLSPGIYEASFNANNLPGGIYFYRLTSGNFSETKRMALIK